MRGRHGLLLALSLATAGVLAASCTTSVNKYISRPVTWTPTPPYNIQRLNVQSWTKWEAPSGQTQRLIRLAAYVETGPGVPISQAKVFARGPENPDEPPQPDFVVAVDTPAAGTDLNSSRGTYERVMNLTDWTPVGTPTRTTYQGDKYYFEVTPVAQATFAYLPPQSIFASDAVMTPVANIRGVIERAFVTNVPAYETSSATLPVPAPTSASAPGSIEIRWNCVEDATLYVVQVVNQTDATAHADAGYPGKADCAGEVFSHVFPAASLKTFQVTIVATDMRLEMYYVGRNPFDLLDISTTTFFVTR